MARMDKVALCSTCQVREGYQLVLNGIILACVHTMKHARKLEDLINYERTPIYDKYGCASGEKVICRNNIIEIIPASLPQEPQHPELHLIGVSEEVQLLEHLKESA